MKGQVSMEQCDQNARATAEMLEKKYVAQEEIIVLTIEEIKCFIRASVNCIQEKVTKTTGSHMKTKMSGQRMTEKQKLTSKRSDYLSSVLSCVHNICMIGASINGLPTSLCNFFPSIAKICDIPPSGFQKE